MARAATEISLHEYVPSIVGRRDEMRAATNKMMKPARSEKSPANCLAFGNEDLRSRDRSLQKTHPPTSNSGSSPTSSNLKEISAMNMAASPNRCLSTTYLSCSSAGAKGGASLIAITTQSATKSVVTAHVLADFR